VSGSFSFVIICEELARRLKSLLAMVWEREVEVDRLRRERYVGSEQRVFELHVCNLVNVSAQQSSLEEVLFSGQWIVAVDSNRMPRLVILVSPCWKDPSLLFTK
jgi:hypothetical protein